MLRRTNSLPAKWQDGLLNLRRSRRILGRFLPKLWRHQEVPPFFHLDAGESTADCRASRSLIFWQTRAHTRRTEFALGGSPFQRSGTPEGVRLSTRACSCRLAFTGGRVRNQ